MMIMMMIVTMIKIIVLVMIIMIFNMTTVMIAMTMKGVHWLQWALDDKCRASLDTTLDDDVVVTTQ